MGSMHDFAARTYETRDHLRRLIRRLEETAGEGRSELIVLCGSDEEWLMFDIAGVHIVFRTAYGLDGTGYLECGHHELDEFHEARFVADLSLEVDSLGNVDQRWTIKDAGGKLPLLLDRTYEKIRERFAGKQVRIVKGIFHSLT